jgi:hypothetical protein
MDRFHLGGARGLFYAPHIAVGCLCPGEGPRLRDKGAPVISLTLDGISSFVGHGRFVDRTNDRTIKLELQTP